MTPNYYGFSPQYDIEQRKRYYFRQNCNTTAKTVLLALVLQFALTFLFEFVYLMILVMPQALQMSMSGPASYAELYAMIQQTMLNDPVLTGGLIYLPTMFIMLLANLLPAWYCSRKGGFRFGDLFHGAKAKPALVLVALVLVFGLNFLGGLIYQFVNLFLGLFGGAAPGSSLSLPWDNPLGMVCYILFVCVIAPVTEEMLFRGALLRTLSRYGTVFAAVASSLFFALLHGNLAQMFLAFLTGLVLSYVTVKTGAIKVAILLHVINNATSVLMEVLLYLFPEGSTGYLMVNLIGNLVFLLALVASVVLLIVLRKRIHFVSDDPQARQRDNLIRIAHPYKGFFSCGFVITFIVLMAVYLLLGILMSFLLV